MPSRMIMIETTEAVSPMAEPIERSISPAMSTTVNPAAMIEIVAACNRTFIKLLAVKK